MELFVRFDRNGKILSVAKVQQMHESLTHPFGGLEEGDDVLRLEPTEELAALDAHEIAAQYSVDMERRTLRK